ncbi:MAG: hypothetical protein D6816_15685, partial [Bacteroidetes bacterium]
VEVTCVVRLAFSKEELYVGLEKESHDVVKDLRISDVMGVELIDPSENEAFSIRTYSEQVQFVEKGLPTEWLFYVKPLKAGTYPLILKISVIEIINGVERKRNVVLEEKVQIVAEPVPEAEDRAAGMGKLSTAVAGIALSGGAAQASPEPAFPAAPVTEVADSVRPAKPLPKKRSGRSKLATALPIALVLVAAVWAMKSMLDTNPINADPSLVQRFENARNKGDVDELRQIANMDPESEIAARSRTVLDSLEKATWEAAIAEHNPNKYLDRFPDGRFVAEANKIIQPHENEDENTAEPIRENNGGFIAHESEQRITAPVTDPVETPATNDGANNPPPVPLAATARKPVYPGCKNSKKEREESCTEKRIRRFVGQQLSYPQEALRKRIEGVVTVSF